MPSPKLDKFLADPKYAEDKEFMQGLFNHFVEEEKKKLKEKKGGDEEHDNLFDHLFGK
jgi:hypothetical protein